MWNLCQPGSPPRRTTTIRSHGWSPNCVRCPTSRTGSTSTPHSTSGSNRTDLLALDLIGQAGATSPTALAAARGMSTGATSAVLDRLEAAGYARREPDAGHPGAP